jgi:cell division protein FtsB
MRQSTLKLVIKLATALAVVVFAVLLVGLTYQYISLNNLEDTQNSLNNELDNLVEVRQGYEQEYNYIENNYNDYIEDYVREVLGWGRQGEIKFTSD